MCLLHLTPPLWIKRCWGGCLKSTSTSSAPGEKERKSVWWWAIAWTVLTVSPWQWHLAESWPGSGCYISRWQTGCMDGIADMCLRRDMDKAACWMESSGFGENCCPVVVQCRVINQGLVPQGSFYSKSERLGEVYTKFMERPWPRLEHKLELIMFVRLRRPTQESKASLTAHFGMLAWKHQCPQFPWASCQSREKAENLTPSFIWLFSLSLSRSPHRDVSVKDIWKVLRCQKHWQQALADLTSEQSHQIASFRFCFLLG